MTNSLLAGGSSARIRISGELGMESLLGDVRAFHQATGTPVLNKPDFPSSDRIDLRNRLLDEELTEYAEAIEHDDIVELADAIADCIYILVGTALEFGIPLDRVWAEVQRSNMAKVDPATGKACRREDGKILKPEGWTPPDIEKALYPK